MSTLDKGTPILSFKVMKSGQEWEAREGRKYLLVEEEGSGYNLYLMPIEEQERAEGEGKEPKEGYNTITVMIPSVEALYNWFNLIYHKAPRFGTKRDHNPDDCC